MNIFLLVFLLFAFFISALITSERYNNISRILFSTCLVIVMWMSFAFSNYEQKAKYICTIPVNVQGKISFAIYENYLINCSKEFSAQFKQGDSIFVFKEIDTWSGGIKWAGGDYTFKINKKYYNK